MLPSATYRVQLRNGVTFQQLEAGLEAIARLGVSHLYLSPICQATAGSTHGYDVTRPDAIDPALGGLDGFRRLARRARAMGLGIILDIVPNHTAFSLENPWLCDVLQHGQDSRFARHFDIDWAAGQLVLPWLPQPLRVMEAEGRVAVSRDGNGGCVLVAGDLRVPLAGDGTGPLDVVLDRQPWRLVHWEAATDSITHRRFFNITDLICMQVDRDAVFEDMHRLVLDLVANGDVQGLRIDHVDGLRAPGVYLAKLRARVGADVPIWVEKILVGDEPLPDWPVEGTTGYEHARSFAQALTPPEGLAALRDLWAEVAPHQADYGTQLLSAKRDILRHDLAAEVLRLVDRARAALAHDPAHEPGPETLRQTVIGLLEGMPVYRTYFGEAGQDSGFAAGVIAALQDHARAALRPATTALRLIDMLAQAQSPAEAAFRDLFQQTSGAVLAKSAEDTALYRDLSFPAFCEVGSEPDLAPLSADAFANASARVRPGAMILTSSHDTKRSEDARMRLVACAHLPDAVQTLWHDHWAMPRVQDEVAQGVRSQEVWAVIHALLAAWQSAADAPDLADRMASYVQKAMREAKEITVPAHPDAMAEGPVLQLARDLARGWQSDLPEAAAAITARGEGLALAQVALKMLSRGVPDVYAGCEGAFFRLTDPDNRPRVDPTALSRLDGAVGFAGRKYRLTRDLLALRRARLADLRGEGATRIEQGPGQFLIRRETAAGEITVSIRTGHEPEVNGSATA